jgi:anti-repressor protein
MNAMQMFNFEGETSVEVLELDGEPLFNATHVGHVLGLTSSAVRKALAGMDVREDYFLVTNSMITTCSDASSIHIRNLANRGELFLTEAGIYELTLQSRKPEAMKFKRWIIREVIPSIRKTGTYGVPQAFSEALRQAADREARLEAESKLKLPGSRPPDRKKAPPAF